MTNKFRWGIIGTGRIAEKFASGLTLVEDAELVAVGSRSQVSADAFGDQFEIPNRHASYRALAQDPQVDAVYIATPHSLHRDNSIACLEAGKGVLCEKPFAINAAQAEDMIKVARANNCFLMEAMWTRVLPLATKIQELIAAGTIGEVRMLSADFGFRTGFNPEGRLFDPNLGGGALLDVGVYVVSFASMVLGTPTKISTLAYLGETGVDEQSAALLQYAQGEIAIIYTAIRTRTALDAVIMGTEGRIRIPSPCWAAKVLTLSVYGQEDQVIELPYSGNGYSREATEVMNCMRAGKLESEAIPLDETLSIMQTMDDIRAQWGLRYPME